MRKNMTFSVCWYKDEKIFNQFKNICIDKDIFEDSYNEWLINGLDTLEKLEKEGMNPIKVNITPEEFKEWCVKNGLPLNGNSRSNYAAYIMQSLDE